MAADAFTHCFVPGAPGNRTTLLLLHGTGGGEDDLLDLGRTLSPGSALLSPRGRVLENGRVTRWFRRLAEGIFDEADVVRRAHELADFVGVAAGRYGFDPAGVVAVGYSNGANIAAATLLLRPETLRGAALLRAMVPLAPATPPDLGGKRVFLAAGRHDAMVPAENIERLAALLRAGGADVVLHCAEAGHGLVAADLEAARTWLASAG